MLGTREEGVWRDIIEFRYGLWRETKDNMDNRKTSY